MQSFWTLSEPEVVIPDGVYLVAAIRSFEYSTKVLDDEHILVTWKVLEGSFKNQELKQKIRVFDKENFKRDKAIKMLTNIYNLADIEIDYSRMPTEEDLRRFQNRIFGIGVAVYEIEDDNGITRTGNWVRNVISESEVVAKNSEKELEAKKKQKLFNDSALSRNAKTADDFKDDDINF